MPQTRLPSAAGRLSLYALFFLALLSAVAPLATDMYLPGFPQMASDLNSSAAPIQLTLTSFLIGLAAGQLLIGPLSDRFGRRWPLLLGTGLAVVSGFLCTFAPNIESLIAFRALQGIGGGAGVVLARAIVSDSAKDARASAQMFQIMMIIGGLAPVLAPLVGTVIVAAAGWRAVFAVTALLSLLSLLGAVVFLKESLPPENRSAKGPSALWAAIGQLLRNRSYVGYTLVTGFSFMALFGYISASSFVMQNVLGLSPTAYSIVFGTNAVGIMLLGAISSWLVRRIEPHRLTSWGVALLLLASLGVLGAVVAGSPVVLMLPALFLAVASLGFILGNATALAIGQAPKMAGTASAFLGALQFSFGAIASPLVGLGGETNALPMAVVMTVAALAAVICFWFGPRSQVVTQAEYVHA